MHTPPPEWFKSRDTFANKLKIFIFELNRLLNTVSPSMNILVAHYISFIKFIFSLFSTTVKTFLHAPLYHFKFQFKATFQQLETFLSLMFGTHFEHIFQINALHGSFTNSVFEY